MRFSRLLFPALAASALFVSACGGNGGGNPGPPPTAPPTVTPTLAPSPSISPSVAPSISPSPSSTPAPSASAVTLAWKGPWSSSLGPTSGSALNPVDFPGTGATYSVTVTPIELQFSGSYAATLTTPASGGGCTSFSVTPASSSTTFAVTANAAGASCTLTIAGASGTTNATLLLNAPATITGSAQ